MKKKFIIVDLKTNECFQGCDPKPIFGDIKDHSVQWNSYEEAFRRIEEEIELFRVDIFQDRILSIIEVCVFD